MTEFWTSIESSRHYNAGETTTVQTDYHETPKGVLLRTIIRTTIEYETGKYTENRLGHLKPVREKSSSSSTDITFIPNVTWDEMNQ
ncbi:hypothetical protein GF420_15625 [candidate division GN15 bacterium]|nr:hypothetical protein [candidate division GN15 bacterium]